MRRFVSLLLILMLSALAGRPALAAVNVNRSGSENPMVEVAKSVIYGGLAGLMVGSAIAVATEGDDGEKIRWGFAGGTLLGLGVGLYWVTTRPSGSALLEIENGKARLAVARPTLQPGAGVHLALVRVKF